MKPRSEGEAAGRARQAAWLMVAAGLCTIANNYLPGAGHLDVAVLDLLGLAAVGIGLSAHLLPWRRWPGQAPLVFAPLAFALIALADRFGGVSAFSYATYFVLVFTWVGLAFPPRTSFLLAPLATAAYVLPGLTVTNGPAGSVSSVTVAIPVCLLVAETISRTMGRVRDAGLDATGQKERYERLVELSQQGIWEVDADARTLFVNQSMAEMLGYTPEEMVGRQLFEFIDDEDRPALEAALRRRRQGISEDHYLRFRHKEQRDVWAALDAQPILGPDGDYLGKIATAVDITEKRRRETALREAEERFRLAFINAPIGMALTSLEGRFLQVNGALCEMLRRPPEALAGVTVASVTHPDDQDADRAAMEEMGGGQRRTFATEKRYLRPDGEPVWARLHAAVVLDEGDRPLYFVSQMEDITQRKAHELALQRSHELLDRSQALASVGSWEWDVTAGPGNGSRWSRQMYRIHGVDPDRFVISRESMEALIHADDLEAWTARFTAAATTGEDLDGFAYRALHPDGSLRWVWTQGSFDPDRPGTLVGFVQDVTDRKRTEAALLASEERTRRILETAGDAFVALDESGRITAWNRQAEVTFGWSADEAVGQPLEEVVIPPDFREAHRRGLRHFLATGEGPVLGRRLELVALHRDGREIPVELVVWALREGDSWSFNAFLRDVSQRKALEEELHRLALVDELTGLRNRRGFLAVAESLTHVAQRNQQDMALLYIDLDNMKAINDRHGHRVGDRALIETAEMLRGTFRESDVLARLGGDEFCVLLPEVGIEAKAVIDRLVEQVGDRGPDGSGALISLSVGVATYQWDDPCSIETLIERADAAMYEQKAHKRRVVEVP